MVQPLFLKTKQTLKTLCYEYNGFEGLTFDKIAETSILGLPVQSDTIYQTMLFAVCEEYWYDEVGFDIDEIFIERFINTWSRYSPIYYNSIYNYINNNIFDITRSRTIKQTDTGTTTSNRSGTDTVTNTGTISNEGSRQDYQVQTQDTDNTQTNNLTNATEYGSKVANVQDLTKDITTVETLTDYTPERLREAIESIGLLNAFVDCFHTLFMQIIVR